MSVEPDDRLSDAVSEILPVLFEIELDDLPDKIAEPFRIARRELAEAYLAWVCEP